MSMPTAPFLKWAGGKRRQLGYLTRKLPPGQRLVEPFVGAGSVFMGTEYDAYLLADSSQDLIDVFHTLMDDRQTFVQYARSLFVPGNNTEARYYHLREQFNHTPPGAVRAALFLYLNRHGYNGLCRYNAAGGFNVPFGAYKQPYFPEREMLAFLEKVRHRHVVVVRQDFRATFGRVRPGDVVYCDPPYTTLSTTSAFTSYTSSGFSDEDHTELAWLARTVAARGIPVLINNHSLPPVNRLYRKAGASVSFKRRGRAINSMADRRAGGVEVAACWNIEPIGARRVV
jgi:DNA adenine methylase